MDYVENVPDDIQRIHTRLRELDMIQHQVRILQCQLAQSAPALFFCFFISAPALSCLFSLFRLRLFLFCSLYFGSGSFFFVLFIPALSFLFSLFRLRLFLFGSLYFGSGSFFFVLFISAPTSTSTPGYTYSGRIKYNALFQNVP